MKTVRVWVGFCGGKPFVDKTGDYFRGPFMPVFKHRQAAKKIFSDFREFRLVPVSKKKGGGR